MLNLIISIFKTQNYIMVFLRLLIESFRFAYNSLIVNKLRTFLSLLGITIGIFCIISVFSIIDSLERTIRDSMESLGSNVIYIQKWPWTPPPGESEYPWWKYLNRPVPQYAEADEIIRRSGLTENAAFNFGFTRTIQSGKNIAKDVTILGSSRGLIEIWGLEIPSGRPFTDEELNAGRSTCILGANVAKQLFPDQSPVGKTLKIQGFRTYIIGVFELMGEDMFGTSMDDRVLIPARFAARLVDTRREMGQSIIVKGKRDVAARRLKEELEGIMRSIRRLKPSEEKNFALNEVSLISGQLDNFFKVFNLAGWIIGGFAVLVGGFGIANIMFVSVRERTNIIGIQKSLGAKKHFILSQFLFESVMLALLGGIAGLLIIYLGSYIVRTTADFELILSTGNVITGIMVSAIIGLIAGYIPAKTAANLDPVEAINTI